MEVKRGKEEETEDRLQGNKVPELTFFTEHIYLQKVFHTNIVFKETGQDSWSQNLFVNHHKQSSERLLQFDKSILSCTALTTFILPLIQMEYNENRE